MPHNNFKEREAIIIKSNFVETKKEKEINTKLRF